MVVVVVVLVVLVLVLVLVLSRKRLVLLVLLRQELHEMLGWQRRGGVKFWVRPAAACG